MAQALGEPLRLRNYDVFAFDLDHTLCRYNLDNLFKLCYNSIVSHLKEIGYPEEIFRPYKKSDKKYCQKGLMFDTKYGNMLKVDLELNIGRASHGTRFLSTEEIDIIYGDDEIIEYLTRLPFIRGETPDSVMARLHCFTDYFTVGTIYLLMQLVDAIDNRKIPGKTYSKAFSDVFDGYSKMYRREAFKEHTGRFFPAVKENPEDYLIKLSENFLQWIKNARSEGKKFVIITSSNVDYAEFLLEYCIGPNWFEYFDSMVSYAKKPGFWTEPERMFYTIKDDKEFEETSELEDKTIYAMGSYERYEEYLETLTKKRRPKMVYVGDSLTDDVYVPAQFCCETIAIVEEIDNDYADSRWHPFFQVNYEGSVWREVIAASCRLTIFSVETLAFIEMDQALVTEGQ